ncbi:Repeat domain-containing protein [Micromonospora citrea]|uniref:Repeat domain-containing protein n=1 Tax=Micromonospora citrea TaxID=47855 RepID=A0A1C6V6R2_9ACTN|nr:VCBS repeat-containing protein [Micromonospora citrea]SCL61570.1 Repeat domain-containing protein [Micromonospora citrea]
MGRSFPAGALATTLALGLLTVPATPAAADTPTAPREVAVIPPADATAPAYEAVFFAGRTGFLHRHGNSPDYLWTRYDTGQSVRVEELAGVQPSALKSAGGDSVYTTAQVPARPAPGKVSVLDLADLSWQQWEIPTDHAVWGVYGQRMLLRTPPLTGVTLELRSPDGDGTWTTTPVTGIPADAKPSGLPPVGDETSVVIGYQADGGQRMALLDLATATVKRIPNGVPSNFWRLSGDTVGWMSSSGQYHLYSRSGLTSGTDTSARLVTVPQDSLLRTVVVDGGLVISRSQTSDTGEYFPATYVPVQTTAPRPTLLPKISWGLQALVQGPDGTALVVGGSGPSDWAVRRITGRPGDTPTVTPVLPVRDPVANAGISYRQGLVRHVQSQVSPKTGATEYVVANHPVFPDPRHTPGERVMMRSTPAACATDVKCVRLVDGAAAGAAYLVPSATTDTAFTLDQAAGGYDQTPLPTTSGRILDASTSHLLVADGASNEQHVVDVGSDQVVRTAPKGGAALWFDTLWIATATAGQLTAVDLATGKTTRTVSTGVACVPTEVQASTRWIYWACGATGPAGVLDLRDGGNLTVPSGPALLGDGFLVRHDTGALRMSAFHDGTLHAPLKLADLAAGVPADGRGVTWAVDRHGSGVAYADADRAVHVVDTGVPSTAPGFGSVIANEAVYPGTTGLAWQADVRPTRPLWSWELTVTRRWTGELVHSAGGGKSRTSVYLRWDGKLPSGQAALNGAYTWTLKGTLTDSAAPVTVGSGELVVHCGTFPFRGYACSGGPGLLGVKSTGEGHWYGTRPTATPGQLYSNGYTENWCLSCSGAERTSALVPFGDFNGDGHHDLLVRDGNGGMKAHLGTGHLGFGGANTLSLGAGWMMYRSILAPGDVNSDGHHDILGIDTDGKLWLYTTTGRGGINPRIQVGSGWGIYPRVTGAGDLNGDGHGDLLGIDSTGTMYHYLSNGNTGWNTRVKVYAGWNIYNSVVAIGDLDEDGRNDLVARDADGVLWRYSGLGNGSFAARVKAGSGWNMFKIII